MSSVGLSHRSAFGGPSWGCIDECTNLARLVPEVSTARAKQETSPTEVAHPSTPRSEIKAAGRPGGAAACGLQDLVENEVPGGVAVVEGLCGPRALSGQLGCLRREAAASEAGELRLGSVRPRGGPKLREICIPGHGSPGSVGGGSRGASWRRMRRLPHLPCPFPCRLPSADAGLVAEEGRRDAAAAGGAAT